MDSLSRSRTLRAAFRALSWWGMSGTREPHGANRLLDIGCGSGGLLEKYRRLGWTVCGIDISARACAACRGRGLEVHQGTVFDAPLGKEEFDLIFLNHVIEHVLDPPGGVLTRVADFLAPGGRILLATPNIRGIGFSLYGSCWYPLDAPRHLFLFSPRTIRALGKHAGLIARTAATCSRPGMLSRSRHYARTQGRVLPPALSRRKALLEASARTVQPYRIYRRLVSPLTFLSSLLGRGDIIQAEFSRAGTH